MPCIAPQSNPLLRWKKAASHPLSRLPAQTAAACHGPRGGLREPLPRHQIRQPRHAATGKRAADAERKQRRAYGKLLLFRHKNAPPCHYCMQKGAFENALPEAESYFLVRSLVHVQLFHSS